MKVLDSKRNFLGLDEEYSNYKDSKVVILPTPYEYSVSYGHGAGEGPEAIVTASQYVEFYDEEFRRELCFDIGIATSEPVVFGWTRDKEAMELIEKRVRELFADDKFVLSLGGEHSISPAPIKVHFDKFPDMSILHLDAHSDLRDSYEGSFYSHACVMARVCDFFPPERLVQVGIRSQCVEEANFVKEKGVKAFYAHEIKNGDHGENWQKKVVEALGDEIYVSFDVDYFDPSVIPATGTPEPDGFYFRETLKIFEEICRAGKKIVGMDLVELAPIERLHHPDFTCAKLIYKILNYAFKKK